MYSSSSFSSGSFSSGSFAGFDDATQWWNAWACSWGVSWGESWGPLHCVEEGTVSGGIGHGKGKTKKKTRIYLEREGKILLFNSNADAAAYVQAEKSLEKPQEAPKRAASKPKKVRKAPEPQVINVEALTAYFTAVQQPEVVEEITQALRLEDFELLIKLQAMWLAEEDDIETLLLVI